MSQYFTSTVKIRGLKLQRQAATKAFIALYSEDFQEIRLRNTKDESRWKFSSCHDDVGNANGKQVPSPCHGPGPRLALFCRLFEELTFDVYLMDLSGEIAYSYKMKGDNYWDDRKAILVNC